jgi:hypothetical protein
MQVTITALLGAATTFYLRRLIMASQAENQKRIDALGEQLDAAAATQAKAKTEILEAIEDLRTQAAEANQEFDFTKVEAAAGTLTEGAQELDDLNEDKPAVEVPPVVEPETPTQADPLVPGASAGDDTAN